MNTSAAQVLHNGQLQTLGQVVDAQQSKVPVIKIAYRKLTDSPKDGVPGNFTLESTQTVWYSPEKGAPVEAGGEAPGDGKKAATTAQTTAARLIPNVHWQSHCSQIVFSVKWLATGLFPVRAQPVLTADCDLGPGRALELCQAATK